MIEKSVALGKKDAHQFITEERIDYKPFVAISDLHLVRKTVPISYESFRKTIGDLDQELLSMLEQTVEKLEQDNPGDFNHDGYAVGFSEGVAAVWDKIREDVLKDRSIS
jgi:hypothetical protein